MRWCQSFTTSNFNEAGAKSAGKPAVLQESEQNRQRTSMRPAQKAPENESSWFDAIGTSKHFNEAGAKSAGKLGRECRSGPDSETSMRPAQKAPENGKVIWTGKCKFTGLQ